MEGPLLELLQDLAVTTCHKVLEFVAFLPNFMLFQIDYHRRHVGKLSFLSYRQALVKI